MRAVGAYRRADEAMRAGEYGVAEAAFRGVLAERPHEYAHLEGLARVLVATERAAEAVGHVRRALALGASDPRLPHLLRALVAETIPYWHFPMMNDARRTEAYAAAIARAVRPGDLVFEIGTGAGLLALLAARAGAARVVTCERVGDAAAAARAIVHTNGMAERVTVVNASSFAVSLDADLMGAPDCIVTEIFGSNVVEEGVLAAVEDAHQRLSGARARWIPARAEVVGALAGGLFLEQCFSVSEVAGFDLRAFNAFVPPTLPLAIDRRLVTFLSAPTSLFCFDLALNRRPSGVETFALEPLESGLAVGVVTWVRLTFADGGVYENAPVDGVPVSGWAHLVHAFPEHVRVAPGQPLEIVRRYDATSVTLSCA